MAETREDTASSTQRRTQCVFQSHVGLESGVCSIGLPGGPDRCPAAMLLAEQCSWHGASADLRGVEAGRQSTVPTNMTPNMQVVTMAARVVAEAVAVAVVAAVAVTGPTAALNQAVRAGRDDSRQQHSQLLPSKCGLTFSTR